MWKAFDLQRIESYRSVAEEFDVDFDVFMSKFPSLPVGQAIVEERKLTAALGIQGFPALVLKTGDREFEMVARGFMSESHLKAILEAALKRFPAQGADQIRAKCAPWKGAPVRRELFGDAQADRLLCKSIARHVFQRGEQCFIREFGWIHLRHRVSRVILAIIENGMNYSVPAVIVGNNRAREAGVEAGFDRKLKAAGI
jgi:hypothetical protein